MAAVYDIQPKKHQIAENARKRTLFHRLLPFPGSSAAATTAAAVAFGKEEIVDGLLYALVFAAADTVLCILVGTLLVS